MSGKIETRRCENCGQPVLRGDTVCWHCGTRLSLPEPTPVNLDEDDTSVEALAPLQQILFYAILTAAVALALLLVTRALGRQPQFIDFFSSDGVPLAAISAPDGSFSLEFPADSTWYFPQAKDGRGVGAAQLVDDPRFSAALSPLFDLVPDAQLLLIAENEAGILSVAGSVRLSRLTTDNVVVSLGNETFPGSVVTEVARGKNRAGAEIATISVAQENPALLCRQVFLPGDQRAYLAAACTAPDQFEGQVLLLNTLLDSLVVR